MGQYLVEFDSNTRKELQLHYKSGDKATIKKPEVILLELTIHPFTGAGQPEEFKHNFAGYWSRRLNKKDRIIYLVEETLFTVFVVSAMGHYSNK